MARYKQSNSQFVVIKNMPDLSSDLKQLKTAFDRLPEKVAKKALRSAVTKATSKVRKQVKQATPLGKTGNLRGGLTRSTKFASKKSKGGWFKFRYGFDKKKAPHALMVEEGTKQRFTRRGVSRGKMPANYFFRDLIQLAAPGIARNIAVELKKKFEEIAKQEMPNAG